MQAKSLGAASGRRQGRYLVPLKDAVRKAQGVSEGDIVTVLLRPAPRS